MTDLIFIDPGMKVNGQYYCDVLLSQQMLPAIKHVLQATRLSFNKTMLHLIVQGHKQLRQEMPDFIGPDLWPPNSPDANLVDYNVWDVMQRRVYECRMNSVDEQKQCLIEV